MVVLWVLVLLSMVAAALTVSSRVQVHLVGNLEQAAKAESLANDGIVLAVLNLVDPNADPKWRADGRVYAIAAADGSVLVSVQHEGGKLDLNQADDEHVARLMRNMGASAQAAEALVDAIADYRDENQLKRDHGAEDPDYRAAGLRHGAKDAPFVSVSELALVMGMTPDLFRRVAPYFTVYSERAKIDLLTAPAEVLMAVPGIFPQDVERLIAARDELRFKGGFPTSLLPVPQTAQNGVFAMPDRAIYTIRAEALTHEGATFVRESVVSVTKGAAKPYLIFKWSRGNIGERESESSEPGS